MEQEKQERLYQKMNAVFQEREALYQKREREIKEYKEELRQIEAGILGEREKLAQEWNSIKTERENLAREREKLDGERKELEAYRESISGELEHILQEKLDLQDVKNERLRQEGEEEARMLKQSREALHQAGRELPRMQKETIGPTEQTLAQPDSGGEQTLKAAEEAGWGEEPGKMEKTDRGEEPDKMEGSGRAEEPEESLSLTQQFAKKAEEIFPEGNALEITDEAFCMGIGDKELRILMQSPPSAVILARREKSKNLMKGINQFNLMQAEWEFSYQNNCLQCKMPFTEATSADVVLQKCADAIKRFFL